MVSNRVLGVVFGVGAGAIAAVGGCSPRADPGCTKDADCEGRGQVCDTFDGMCVPAELDIDSTEDPAPMSFTNKPVPFFRGTACTVGEVKSGALLPVSINPCLHPCIERGSHHFKQFYSCRGSTCDAMVVLWVDANSGPMGCPENAFGRFDQSQCTYGNPIEFTIDTTTGDGSVISGSMTIEVPFLTNEDIAKIVADDSQGNIENLAQQYPRQNNRIIGGDAVSILANHPEPATPCNGAENCQCGPIGF